MAFCKQCGSAIEEGVRFCGKCGTEVVKLPMRAPASPVTNAGDTLSKVSVPQNIYSAQNTHAVSSAPIASSAAPKKSRKGLAIVIVVAVIVVAIIAVVLGVFVVHPADTSSPENNAVSSDSSSQENNATSSDGLANSQIPAGQPTTSAGIGASTLMNSDYSIRANLPSGYTLAEYYDGNAVWTSPEGDMRITASGMRNTNHYTLSLYQGVKERDYRNISYRASGDDWFVLSGDDNGETYYVKCYVGPNYIKSVAFSYTSGKSGDAVIEQVYSTIDVGSI